MVPAGRGCIQMDMWAVEGSEYPMGVTQKLQELGVEAAGGKKEGCTKYRKTSRMRTLPLLPNKGRTGAA